MSNAWDSLWYLFKIKRDKYILYIVSRTHAVAFHYEIWWDQPHSLLYASPISLLIPFQIDIRARQYIQHRWVRRDGSISAHVTTSSPRLKARAWCSDLCWDEQSRLPSDVVCIWSCQVLVVCEEENVCVWFDIWNKFRFNVGWASQATAQHRNSTETIISVCSAAFDITMYTC